MTPPRLVLVTPEGVSRERIAEVVRAGADVFGDSLLVQARAKSGRPALVAVAEAVALAARSAGVPFAVNGDVELAESLGADAFHAPGALPLEGLRERMQHAWISRAAHDERDVIEAGRAALDAVLVSPVYSVPGKAPARGLSALSEARLASAALWVIALGGVTTERAVPCLRAGAHGIAVMRAVFDAPRPRDVLRALAAAFASRAPSREC